MKTLNTLLVILIAFTPLATAKRKAPAEVNPITIENVTISAPHFGSKQNGGTIQAHDAKTKKLLWQLQVYKTDYNNRLETDVQDVFIKTLSHDKTHHLLILSDEKDRVFIVDLKTKTVTQLKKS